MRFASRTLGEHNPRGRSNTVQVVDLSMSAVEANAAAVDLAKKIGPQLPQ